jgi:hypothetical protein
LDLSSVCTASAGDVAQAYDAGNLFQQLPRDVFWFHNVPYQLPASPSDEIQLIALRNSSTPQEPARLAFKTRPSIEVPLPEKPLHRLQLVVAALDVTKSGVLATASLVSAAGVERELLHHPIKALGPRPTARLRKEAVIQDWWPQYEIARNNPNSAPLALVTPQDALEEGRIFYVINLSLPESVQPPVALRVTMAPRQTSTLCIFAISLATERAQ